MPQMMCYLQALAARMADACASLLDKVEQLGKASAFAEAFKKDIRRGPIQREEHRHQLAGCLE